MRGKELVAYKQTLILTDLQKQVLVGTLLGDASIPDRKNNSEYNVKFEQKYDNVQYVNHLYDIFKPWVGTSPSIREISGGGALDRKSIWFRTYRHPAFRDFYNKFYLHGHKIVPRDISEILTPVGLAYWFMDDGTKQTSGYHLSTQGFKFDDNNFLLETLNKKFFLDSKVHKDRHFFRIYIPAASVLKFNLLVKPYILSTMSYKLHL
jgi:hypothetical protein